MVTRDTIPSSHQMEYFLSYLAKQGEIDPLAIPCPSCHHPYTLDPEDPPGRCQVCLTVYCPDCRDEFMAQDEARFDRFHEEGTPPLQVLYAFSEGRKFVNGEELDIHIPGIALFEDVQVPKNRICDRCLTTTLREQADPEQLDHARSVEEFWSQYLRPAAAARLKAMAKDITPDTKRLKMLEARSTVNIYDEPREVWQKKSKAIRDEMKLYRKGTWQHTYLSRLLVKIRTPESGGARDAIDHELWTEEVDDLASEALLFWAETYQDRIANAPADRFEARQMVLEGFKKLYVQPADPLNGDDDKDAAIGKHGYHIKDGEIIFAHDLPNPEEAVLLKEELDAGGMDPTLVDEFFADTGIDRSVTFLPLRDEDDDVA